MPATNRMITSAIETSRKFGAVRVHGQQADHAEQDEDRPAVRVDLGRGVAADDRGADRCTRPATRQTALNGVLSRHPEHIAGDDEAEDAETRPAARRRRPAVAR